MDDKKLKALIYLLDDSNDEVYKVVEDTLLQEEVSIVPMLEDAWSNNDNSIYQKRIENLIHNLQFKNIKNELRKWVLDSEDLLYGAYIVAKYIYPELRYEVINTEITKIKTDIWLELNDNLTAIEKVKILNHILFNIYNFSRNTKDLFSPDNSLINSVLSNRKGNIISIAIIYSVIAQRLDMPIYGVSLPTNFVLAYMDDTSDLVKTDSGIEGAVLFYVNPINEGLILGKKEIEFFIRQQKLDFDVSYFLPCSNYEIVRRLLNNLVVAYEAVQDREKVEELEQLLLIIP